MNILALDLATQTGWATNYEGKRCGTAKFEVKRGESPGMRFLRCRAWLKDMRDLLHRKIDLIVYEQAHYRGGAATAACVGLATEVIAFAAEYSIEIMAVHTKELKRFATGKGNAKKPEMIQAAKDRGYEPANDDEGDAALLLEFAMSELKL